MKASSFFATPLANINYFLSLIKKKNYFMVFYFLLTFVCIFFGLTISFKPFNYICNASFVILLILTIAISLKRQTFSVDGFILFWLFFIIITFIINMVNGYHGITPYITSLFAIMIYTFVKTSNLDEKKLYTGIFYFSFITLLVGFAIKYLIPYISNNSISVFNDNFFGNLDGVGNYLAILFFISLFYIKKKDFLSIVIAILSLVFVFITQRRTAILLCGFSIIAFAYSFFKKGQKVWFLIGLFLFIGLFYLCLFIPAFYKLFARFFENDGSESMRINMIERGFFYGFANLIKSFGFNGSTGLYHTPPHDYFGDVSYSYGGAFAILTSIITLYWGRHSLKAKGYFGFMSSYLFILMPVLFLLGSFVQNRIYVEIIAVCYGLIETNSKSSISSSKIVLNDTQLFEINC